MPVKKIDTIKLRFKDKIYKSVKVKIALSDDEKARLREVKKDMGEEINKCKKELEEKNGLFKKIKKEIKDYRAGISSHLGILSPKQLHEIKLKYSKEKYKRLYTKNMDNLKRLESMLIKYINENFPEYENLKTEIEDLQSEIDDIPEHVRQWQRNSWYIFGEEEYKKIPKAIKNENPYYIDVLTINNQTGIQGALKFYGLPYSAMSDNYLISPLEKYITLFKRGKR